MVISAKLKRWLRRNGHVSGPAGHSTYQQKAAELLVSGELPTGLYKSLSDCEVNEMSKQATPEQVYGGRKSYNVKAPSSMYSEKRFTASHAKTGMPVVDPIRGRECESMSEGSKARAGVLLKALARKAGVWRGQLTEHEENLLSETAVEHDWCGHCFGEYHDRIGGDMGIKALIEDSTSGGIEIVPREFDADVITFPLLSGELFPLVDLKPVPRGRRIEGASISTPTMSWGGYDQSEIALFNTASMVAGIDTTIFAIDAAVEVGRDFLSDSPVAVGETLTALVGERLQAELDKVIATGNGTTQPEGLFTASGVTTVASDNGNVGPPTLNDYETLMFSIGKQYRRKDLAPVFVSNDTSYQRSRAIRIDPNVATTDQRPVFGLEAVNSYMTIDWPHKISNDLANTRIAFGCMKRYRMYRRLGLSIEWSQEGSYLKRHNLALLIVRGRFGGKVMDANAFAKIIDAQS
jgi:HK97 family phage major capsid protein